MFTEMGYTRSFLFIYSFLPLHSHQKGVPKVGLIGEGRLIAGIEKGIVGMCINERRKVTVPSHLAYGAAGASNPVANVTYSSGSLPSSSHKLLSFNK